MAKREAIRFRCIENLGSVTSIMVSTRTRAGLHADVDVNGASSGAAGESDSDEHGRLVSG